MKNKTLIISILLLPILISISSACSCIGFVNTENKLNNAEYIFSGKVLNIKLQSNVNYPDINQEVTLNIIDYWKPLNFPEPVNLILYSYQDNGANCGYNFEENKDYLVYAYLDKETGRFSTNSCMGNIPFEYAFEEIEILNNLTNNNINEPNNGNNNQPEQSIFYKIWDWIKNILS